MAKQARLLIGITLLWVITQAVITSRAVHAAESPALSRCDFELAYNKPITTSAVTVQFQF